ncbi:conserved hypothetical protein [Ricinus communis]|uniref:Uncharacterized protein n=1 Tax=Ricinus communis TaxID=3988 RepID=B9R8W8_RICCO|nr:conserved hypothetical protein [Ricinus communis]
MKSTREGMELAQKEVHLITNYNPPPLSGLGTGCVMTRHWHRRSYFLSKRMKKEH